MQKARVRSPADTLLLCPGPHAALAVSQLKHIAERRQQLLVGAQKCARILREYHIRRVPRLAVILELSDLLPILSASCHNAPFYVPAAAAEAKAACSASEAKAEGLP